MHDDHNIFREIWKAMKDDTTRFRALSCTFIALIVSMIPISMLFYSMFASKGCKINVSFVELVLPGIAALFFLFLIWFASGFVIYGMSYLPKLFKDAWADWNDPENRRLRAVYKADSKKNRKPFMTRVTEWLKNYWKHILILCAMFVGVAIVSYLFAYMFWLIYC